MAEKPLRIAVVSTLLAALTFVILWAFLPIDMFVVHFMVPAMVVLVSVLSFEFVSDTPLDLDKVTIGRIAHGLRARGYFVEEKEGRVWVRINQLTRIVLISGAEDHSSSFRFKVDPTPVGWSVLLVLLFFGISAPFIIPVLLYMLIKTSSFADNLVPRIAATDVTRLEEKEGGIRHLLVDSLSEGYRLSAEALESTISDYHDSILVSVSLAIVLFMTSFALMIVEFADSQLDIAAVAGLPLALALVLISLLTWFVSRHYRPFIMRLRSWYDRFQDALEFEAVGGEVRDDWQSSFELLAEATKELPKWIRTRQKSMLHTHPAVSSLIFVLALIGFNMFVSAAFILQDWWGILTVIAALSILGLSAWLFHVTRRNDQEESHRTMVEWRARLDRTSAETERLIEDM